MRAAVYRSYGPPEVVRIEEVGRPIPREGEVLVRVRAASVAAADWRLRKADPFLARLFNGLFRPRRFKVLGLELAGDVVALGPKTTRFAVGDAIFGFTGFGFGAHAEYRTIAEHGTPNRAGLFAHKPVALSYEEAASLPLGALTALAFLRRAGLGRGERLLVHGASGSVGTAAVQLGRYLGAEVVGVTSGANAELVRSLGASSVIDYTTEDFTRRPGRFDVVFDAVGKTSKSRCRGLLGPDGRFVSVKGRPGLEADDILTIKELVELGHLRPVIDKRYELGQIVEAHRYVEAGHKRGNVVVSLAARTIVAPQSGFGGGLGLAGAAEGLCI